MKAKKGICSSDCECLTITWWRCYAEEHLCNCGDWGSTPPVPPTPIYSISKTTETDGWYDMTKYSLTKTTGRRSVEFLWIQMEWEFSIDDYDWSINCPSEFLASNDSNFRSELKCIWECEDKYEWYQKFEQAVAWEITAEELWTEFSELYESLEPIAVEYTTSVDYNSANVTRWATGVVGGSCLLEEDSFGLAVKQPEQGQPLNYLYRGSTSSAPAFISDATSQRLMSKAVEAEWNNEKSKALYFEMQGVFKDAWHNLVTYYTVDIHNEIGWHKDAAAYKLNASETFWHYTVVKESDNSAYICRWDDSRAQKAITSEQALELIALAEQSLNPWTQAQFESVYNYFKDFYNNVD